MPNIVLDPIAIVAAVIAGFMFCYLYNGVLFDKLIRAELGISDAEQPQGAQLAKSLVMTLIGIGFMSFVLSTNIAAWTPETWGITLAEGEGMPAFIQALNAAFFSWLGFMCPMLLDKVAWERRSWKFFAIEAGYYFLLLLIIALILLFV